MKTKENLNLSPLAVAIQEGAILVDVRSPEEFAEGSAEGAINIPLFSIPLRIDELKSKRKIIVFCASGGRSEQAKMFLKQQGIDCENGGCWFDVDDACKELYL